MNYGMPGFVVPHSIYPNGYHCDPKLPLPFIGYASQKNFVALYHCGIYTSPNLLDWFKTEFQNHSKTKLDMGKSCIRFKKMENIPFDLIGDLVQKMTVKNWIKISFLSWPLEYWCEDWLREVLMKSISCSLVWLECSFFGVSLVNS